MEILRFDFDINCLIDIDIDIDIDRYCPSRRYWGSWVARLKLLSERAHLQKSNIIVIMIIIYDLWFMIITTIIAITSTSITRIGAVLWYCAITTWQPLIKSPPNNLSIFIPNKQIISNTSSPPSPPHYPHQLIMVLTSSACFWFSTSSSLILWSFKLLRPKIYQSKSCFLTRCPSLQLWSKKGL